MSEFINEVGSMYLQKRGRDAIPGRAATRAGSFDKFASLRKKEQLKPSVNEPISGSQAVHLTPTLSQQMSYAFAATKKPQGYSPSAGSGYAGRSPGARQVPVMMASGPRSKL